MTLSLRLDDDLAEQLAALAERQGVSKSELVRRCLEELVSREQTAHLAWERGKHLFGRRGSGSSNLSRDSEQIAGEAIDAKHRRR